MEEKKIIRKYLKLELKNIEVTLTERAKTQGCFNNGIGRKKGSIVSSMDKYYVVTVIWDDLIKQPERIGIVWLQTENKDINNYFRKIEDTILRRKEQKHAPNCFGDCDQCDDEYCPATNLNEI